MRVSRPCTRAADLHPQSAWVLGVGHRVAWCQHRSAQVRVLSRATLGCRGKLESCTAVVPETEHVFGRLLSHSFQGSPEKVRTKHKGSNEGMGTSRGLVELTNPETHRKTQCGSHRGSLGTNFTEADTPVLPRTQPQPPSADDWLSTALGYGRRHRRLMVALRLEKATTPWTLVGEDN